MEKNLTPKEQKFVNFYIETGNATQSYKLAGYKYSSDEVAMVNSCRMLRKHKVKTAIDAVMQQKQDERIARQDEILRYLTSVMRGEVMEEVVVVDDTGARKILKQVSVKDRNKAAELLAKRYGLLTEKISLDANVGITIIDDIPNDEEA